MNTKFYIDKLKNILKKLKMKVNPQPSIELKTASYWDNRYGEKTSRHYKIRSWAESNYILSNYINPLISGIPNKGWFEWSAENYLRDKPYKRALVMGCGCGNIERHAHELALFEHIDAFDISKTAIQEAIKQSRKYGYFHKVNYNCQNFIGVSLPQDTYNVIYMDMTLHHVEELEVLLEKIKKAKKKDVYFILHEYVGPNRFQWSDVQIEHGNRILNLLPENLRIDCDTGKVKVEFNKPLLSQMIVNDPSEAIRSADILKLIYSEFEVIDRRDYGGTILHPLLNNIIHNFHPESIPEHAKTLNLLFQEEQKLLKNGTLQSDFALFVLK